MKLSVAVLPGDGVGPEVVEAGMLVLRSVAEMWGHELLAADHAVGWQAISQGLPPLPEETLGACVDADAVLLGAVGDPRGDELPPASRPEAGLLVLRKKLGCFANLRPVMLPDALQGQSPLKPHACAGTDLVIVRELGGGLYYGTPRGKEEFENGSRAVNTLSYTSEEVERIAHIAFRLAAQRNGRVVSVDKANVLEVSQLWRASASQVGRDYPEVELQHMLVDRAALELTLRPNAFDVILTENMFGDILSDQAAGVVGSLGLLGSASVGGSTDLFEPVHGSAPDIAGKDRANPVGLILSVALMLRHSFGLEREAVQVERAIEETLKRGLRTADVFAAGENGGDSSEDSGLRLVGTREFGEAVARCLPSEDGQREDRGA